MVVRRSQILLFVCALAAVCAFPRVSTAQQVKLTMEKGPYFAGVPTLLSLQLLGFEVDPEPFIEVVAPDGCTIERQGGVSSSQQITNFNGVVKRVITLTYSYALIASKPGLYEVGPFVVTQAAGTPNEVKRQSQKGSVRVEELSQSDRMELKLVLPEKPIIPGQRVKIALEWRLENSLLENQGDYSLTVPLFGMVSAFDFIDETPLERGKIIECETSAGGLKLGVTIEPYRQGATPWVLIRAERSVIARRAGKFELAPATIVLNEVTRWRQDFFGRQPAATRKVMTRDLARELEVAELPRVGRPASFSGAIGTGFAIEVSADRSVVKAGDPIRLTVRVRGNGQLESIELPPLDADGGLDSKLFRLPTEEVPGRIEDGQRVFEATVRVLSERVREVPPLAFSWFDPEQGKYETARSLPIALQVREGETIGAASVVTGAPSNDVPRTEPPASGASPNVTTSKTTFSLSGADLSLATDRAVLLSAGGDGGARRAVVVALYALSCGFIGLAVLGRRRAERDPRIVEQKRALGVELERLRGARRTRGAAAVSEIATALRAMLASVPAARGPEIDTFLADCEAVIYAPAGVVPDERKIAELCARAEELAQRITEAAR
ncbi:MAG: BatD family protein [Planctomycetota bacterium]